MYKKSFQREQTGDPANNQAATIAFLLLISCVLLLSPVIISAQAVSGVTGVVTDANGSVVPDVQVTLADPKTNREFTATTNNDGIYVFNNIQPGEGYRLTFTKQGFQTSVLNNVTLGIGQTETRDVQITAGDVSATVEVTTTSGEATLNTTDSSIGNVIGERQLRELPIQFRNNPAALIGLQPGVVGTNVGTGAENRVGSVTGSRPDQGNITVDGIDSNDATTGQAFVSVGNLPIDSVQEFRAVSTNPSSSEGRSSGGQIQLATRSGTNKFHGSLREYYRDERAAANAFFNNRVGTPREKLRRHQFGGSLSGPLPFPNFGEGGRVWNSGKDRLFFFFDYEGRRDNSEDTVTRTVPLQSFREGRIGYVNNSAGCTSSSRTANCLSYLTPEQIKALDPAGIGVNQALLSFINSRYPLPNDLSGGGINTGIYRFNAPDTRTDNTYTARIDGNITDNQRIFGRTTITRRDITNASRLFAEDEDAVRLLDKSYQWVVGHTWVITPSFTNQATVGVSRQIWDFPAASSPAFPNSFTGGGVLTSPFASMSFQDRNVIVPTYRNDSTWTAGAHTFQFGGQFKPIRQKTSLTNDFNFITLGIGGGISQLPASLRPANILTSSTTPGTNFDAAFAFLLGRFANLTTNYSYDVEGNALPLGTGRVRNLAYDEYEFYVQDNWRVRSDLTLNLGVRYHIYPSPYEQNGFQTGTNNPNFEDILALRVANAANGVAGVGAEPLISYDLVGKGNDARPWYNTDWNNFAPRVGFNYSPSFKDGFFGRVFGERKTVIRGGFSKVFDRVAGALPFILDQYTYVFDSQRNTPFGSSLNVTNSLLTDPRFVSLSQLPIQNTPPVVSSLPITPYLNAAGRPVGLANNDDIFQIDQNFEIPYSYQWSLGVQREVPGNMILDVSYVGRAARKLLVQADVAQTLNFKDTASGQFMYDALNGVQTELQAGTSLANLTRQPWLENQVLAGIRDFYGQQFSCGSFGASFANNCTRLVANFFGTLTRVGGTADLVQQLYLNGLLRPNVGLPAQTAVNSFISNYGSADYNGLLVSLRKRFSRGFQFDANYTWSHALDNQSTVTRVGGGLICDVTDLNACRSDSDVDIRHLFNANGIWDIPIGRGRAIGGNLNKFVNAFVGGWTLSGIFTARSGLPTNALSGSYSVGFFTNSPLIFSGDAALLRPDIRDEGTGIQYFADPAAVQAALRYPRHGESGNRNRFRSPGFWNVDLALSKRFAMPWSENHRLTLRVEAYNLTNSNFFSSPNLTLGSTSFGLITAVQSVPRELQFAIRYDF